MNQEGESKEIEPQRIEYKNRDGLTLIGDFYPSSSKSGIVLVHGTGGDRRERGRFEKTATELQSLGYNVFSFDLSGCGESPLENPDLALNPSRWIDDLRSATDYLRSEKGIGKVGLLGLSFGAYIALRAYDPSDIEAVVLWAPVTNFMTHPEEYYLKDDGKNFKDNELNFRKNGIVQRINERTTGKITIDREFFEEWEKINQKALLSTIQSPILIIHGDMDSRIPLSDSENALKYLLQDSKLEVINGADHSLEKQIDKVIQETSKWFIGHLAV